METPVIVASIGLISAVFALVFAYFRDKRKTSIEITGAQFTTFSQLTEAAQKAVTDLAIMSSKNKQLEIQHEARKIQAADAIDSLKASHIENGELRTTLAQMQSTLEEIKRKLRESEDRENILHRRVLELESQMGISAPAR